MSRIHVDITAARAENARLPAVISRATDANTALRRLTSSVDPRILRRSNLQARLSAACNEAAAIERQAQSIHAGISQFLGQYLDTERRLRADAINGNLNNKQTGKSSSNRNLFSDAERRRGLSVASAMASAVGVGVSAMANKVSLPFDFRKYKQGATGAVVRQGGISRAWGGVRNAARGVWNGARDVARWAWDNPYIRGGIYIIGGVLAIACTIKLGPAILAGGLVKGGLVKKVAGGTYILASGAYNTNRIISGIGTMTTGSYQNPLKDTLARHRGGEVAYGSLGFVVSCATFDVKSCAKLIGEQVAEINSQVRR